ncbi:MAG: AMP-binding protein, partial [Candidatus Tectomicrobia bacterium]
HDPMIVSFTDVQERGRQLDAQQPTLFEANVARGQGSDVAMFCFTSGTTGDPKAVMLSHHNGLFMAENFLQVDEITDSDELVSFLPFAWAGEQIMAVFVALMTGCTVNFPENSETLQHDLREIGPHVMFAPPRVWEQICSDYQVKITDASFLKRCVARYCMAIGERIADRKLERKAISPMLQLQYKLAYLLLFRALKDRFGLTNLRHVYTGGAPLGPEIFKFYQAIGVNIRQIYGQTEVAGISVVHRANDIKLETVGQPIPNTEITISEDGEILTRGEAVFKGYYKNAEATASAIRDGWLYSGDAGWLDEDGHLVMLDRMKDVLQLADGSKFSPQLIENKLKFSPYIRESIAIGKDRPFVIALIQIDLENAGKWAEEHRLPYTTFRDLSQKPEIKEMIGREVDRVNSEVPRPAQIRQFALLEKELDADDDELTRTQKVRRSLVHEKYHDIIEALYQAGAART